MQNLGDSSCVPLLSRSLCVFWSLLFVLWPQFSLKLLRRKPPALASQQNSPLDGGVEMLQVIRRSSHSAHHPAGAPRPGWHLPSVGMPSVPDPDVTPVTATFSGCPLPLRLSLLSTLPFPSALSHLLLFV